MRTAKRIVKAISASELTIYDSLQVQPHLFIPDDLLAPTVENPFAPGREVAFARVSGTLLEPLGVRDGDHVALARRDEAEHGDLAAVVGGDGSAALWKVYPEGESLRLSTGDPVWSRRTIGRARVTGVVVGVLRKFAG